MSDFWYYAEGNETRGPITFDQLVKILLLLPTARGTLVWREGFDDWRAAENVREIVEKLIRPPPLRPRSSVLSEERFPAVTKTTLNEGTADQGGLDTVARYQQQFRKVKPELIGLGGWLALLGFGLVSGMLKSLVKTMQSWSSVDAVVFQTLPTFAYGGLILEGVWLLLFMSAIILFFKKSRKFPPNFILLLITSIVMPFIIFLWVRLTLPNRFEITQLFGPEEIGQMIAGLISAILWIPYILKSKRVVNTFIN
jgi:hypothetical protein